MKKGWLWCQVFFLAVAISLLLSAPALAGTEPLIRVMLGENISSFSITVPWGNSGYTVQDGPGYPPVALSPGDKVEFAPVGANIQVKRNGTVLFTGGDRVEVVAPNWDTNVSVSFEGGRRYRGDIVVLNRNGKLRVVNRLPLEKYLYGVVPAEMPASWPAEAVKAQAIAARTYAFYRLKDPDVKDTGDYDVCDTVLCQVYSGKDVESSSANACIDATRGKLAYYNGKPIDALFHANAGGITENAKDVWGNDVPYLRSKDSRWDAYAIGTWGESSYCWRVEKSRSELERNLGVSPIASVQPEKVTSTGRVKTLRVTLQNGGTVSKSSSLLGLKSNLFTVSYQGSTVRDIVQDVPSAQVQVEGAAGRTTVDLSKAFVLGAGGTKVAVTLPAKVINSVVIGEKFIFVGRGDGHGVGMSQWGAYGMAKEGYTAAQIISHYYNGAYLYQAY
ncbi:MAG: stage sporulation protein [Eubacteriales bacterium]|nr:stage sporulation protein [Eubacteriales bacterium]MDN5364189.1 stage sporulation protein [Eubacteriales bacterium]